MAKVVLEPAVIDANAPSAHDTFESGLEMARMIDSLNLELHGVKSGKAKEWKRKHGRFARKEA
ncbi:MAG: hypothetical protein WC325_10210 [Candidatus Bathyarchaeia archaeon]